MSTTAPRRTRRLRALLAVLLALAGGAFAVVTHPAYAQEPTADLRLVMIVHPLGGNNYNLLVTVNNRGSDAILCCPGNEPTFTVVITLPDNARFGIEQVPRPGSQTTLLGAVDLIPDGPLSFQRFSVPVFEADPSADVSGLITAEVTARPGVTDDPRGNQAEVPFPS